MKKCTVLFLIFLCLSFNIISATPVAAATTFKEGLYKAADFKFSSDNLYYIQNISEKDNVYVLLFDENQLQIQSIRLGPKSLKYNLLPLKPEYRIVIVGNGSIDIS